VQEASVNDFLGTVKPAFAFLAQERGYELLDEDVADSFDNGLLIYQSATLRIAVTRDRGQVLCSVRARGDYRDIDEQIVRLLIDGARHFPRVAPPADFRPAAVAGFLREHLIAIEQLFAAPALVETLRTAAMLQSERAELLFGRDREA
jgi:hypothetical protein